MNTKSKSYEQWRKLLGVRNALQAEVEGLKFQVARLNAALDADVGIYPRAISGGKPEECYEKRTEFMEGFNAAIIEIRQKQQLVMETFPNHPKEPEPEP